MDIKRKEEYPLDNLEKKHILRSDLLWLLLGLEAKGELRGAIESEWTHASVLGDLETFCSLVGGGQQNEKGGVSF